MEEYFKKIPAAVELIIKNPAVELGIFNLRGSLEVGKAADITIFDDYFNVKRVAIGGVF